MRDGQLSRLCRPNYRIPVSRVFFTAPHARWNAHVSLLLGSSLQAPVHALLNAFRKIACALLGKVFLVSSGRSAVLFHGIKGEWCIMVYKGRLGLGGKLGRFYRDLRGGYIR